MSNFLGFISRRGESIDVCHYLKHSLSSVGINVACQEDLATVYPQDHREAARRLINSSQFSIILITPSLFDPPIGEEHCEQKIELINIQKKIASEEKSNTTKKSSYGIYLLLIQNSVGYPAASDLKAAVQNDEALNWLADLTVVEPIVSDREKRIDALKSFAGKISNWYVESNAKRSFTDQKSSAQSNEKRPEASNTEETIDAVSTRNNILCIEDAERAYLDTHARMWWRGRVSQMAADSPDGPAPDAGESPFSFQAQRFIELCALVDEDSKSANFAADKNQNLIPVSRLILRDRENPLILQGEAGAGKTTTLAAAASAMAAKWDPQFELLSNRFSNGEWSQAANDSSSGDTTYLPVIMSCSVIAAHFEPGRPSSDGLLDAVVEQLGVRTDDQESAREDLRERMEKQPYALLLDGLDEVDDPAKGRALLESAIDLCDSFHPRRNQVKLVVTSRPLDSRIISAEMATLERLSWRQITAFLTAYIDAEAGENRESIRSRIAEEADTVWRSGDATSDPLKTPLLLNAFCWLQIRQGGFRGNRARFCREVIDQLLAIRAFQHPDGSSLELPLVRRLLQRLAFDATGSEMGDGALSEADAKAVIDEWVRSVDVAKIERPNQLMRMLSQNTGLFYPFQHPQGALYYSFAKRELFREYLSGERLARGSLIRTTIRSLKSQPDQLEKWKPSIAFAAAILVSDTDVTGAMHIPEQLVEMAESCDDAKHALNWISATLAALTEFVSRLTTGSRSHFFLVIERVVNVYTRFKTAWSPSDRSEVVERLFKLSRHTNVSVSDDLVLRTQDLLVGGKSYWVAVPGLPGIEFDCTHVLVGQYSSFVNDKCREERYWLHAESGEQSTMISSRESSDSKESSTGYNDKFHNWVRQMERPGSPVIYVTWFEAVAYCLWATEVFRAKGSIGSDEIVRLPTAAEWKTVASICSAGKRYPWGGRLSVSTPEQAQVNTRYAGIGKPSAPGVFDSYGLEGLYDFGSNVRCWVLPDAISWSSKGPRKLEEEEDVQVAGGAWTDFEQEFFNCDADAPLEDPMSRAIFRGFRVVRARMT